jgi:hypothetical protein
MDYQDLVTPSDQTIDQTTADELGTAKHYHPHIDSRSCGRPDHHTRSRCA